MLHKNVVVNSAGDIRKSGLCEISTIQKISAVKGLRIFLIISY